MTRSGPTSLYDDDFFAWTQAQAAALRNNADALDHAVDIVHVAEEIEDLGKRDLREVTSYLARLLEHLIKTDGSPASRDLQHWRSEAIDFQASALEAFSPSMRRALAIEDIWRMTRRRVAAAIEAGAAVAFPVHPPLQIERSSGRELRSGRRVGEAVGGAPPVLIESRDAGYHTRSQRKRP